MGENVTNYDENSGGGVEDVRDSKQQTLIILLITNCRSRFI